ncbi:asparagine synthase (glutamine-hydrolyzing) [Aneurinibacillus sp. REN35]|uniref:asparagine synthase (glutamine-hydrolyzing) n=1 Tax=Aneurinibacillus sp. REN35 TaxID=3237286 RepID=UPI003527D63D
MCGIAGIIANSHLSIKDNGRRMLDVLNHRGPDGSGEWFASKENIWIGHRRLAIIDPEGGKQPLSNEDGTIWITFNGCIYNYLELAQSLRGKGHRFRTYTDTEVIIHAYEEFGVDCVKYFIGMFSFAIWDDRKKIMFCARDRMGIKPFYYWKESNTFIFASEIKAILATDFIKKQPNYKAIQEYLVFQTVPGEHTLFKGINKLLPGHYLIINEEGRILDNLKYWDVNFDIDTDHTEEYFLDRLRTLLEDAVKIRLRSDVALGAHLSGGLDSSTIVSLASAFNITGDKLKTFTGAFDEGERFDETQYARMVAEKSGAQYLETYPTGADFVDVLPKIIYHMDEPSAGPGVFPQFMVSQLASEHVKVVLGGQGGDEIFGGYTRYLVGYLEECLKGAIEETDERNNYAATLRSIIPSLPMLKQYTPMLKYFWSEGLFDSQDQRYFRLMNRSGDVKHIYNSDIINNNEHVFHSFQDLFHGSNAESFLNRMLYFDMKVHLPALLHVEDRTSMAWGVESRVPLLDHRIAELLSSIPPVIKFKGGQPKYLFRKVIKNLIPEQVFNRKDKMGFPVPLHLWFRNSLGEFAKEVLLDKGARERGIFDPIALEAAIKEEKDFGRVIWGALCLELWFKTFIDD